MIPPFWAIQLSFHRWLRLFNLHQPIYQRDFIVQGSTATGYRSFTIEYIIANPVPNPLPHLPPQLRSLNGCGQWRPGQLGRRWHLTINPLINDDFSGPVTVSINQATGNAAVVNNQIVYSNASFGLWYGLCTVHFYRQSGHPDQGIIKIEEEKKLHRRSAIRLCGQLSGNQNITVPAGFTLDQFLQRWSKCVGCKPNFLHTWRIFYWPGQLLFFQHRWYHPGLSCAYHRCERDPGFVRMMSFTPKNTPITFDVFANDLVKPSHHRIFTAVGARYLGIFTYTPPTNFSGNKLFTYKVDSGGIETGKITLVVGNQTTSRHHL